MRAYAYMLRCADDTLYCGWTNDLTHRLAAHNSGQGAKYTRGRGPVRLAYSELFATQGEAMRREAQLKKLTRPQKEALLAVPDGAELLTVYDGTGLACGERPRAEVHAQGLFHHVCHLWVCGVYEGEPGLWLQRRADDRPLYPGHYDLTATGHIDPGETPETAILREAREEAGLRLAPDALVPAGAYRQQYDRGEGGGFDDELAYAFLCRMDGPPPFAPGPEVSALVFAPLSAFALAHEESAPPLPARAPGGGAVSIPRELFCCLHQQEWEGVLPVLQDVMK